MRLAFLALCLIPASAHAQVGALDTTFGDGGIVVDSISFYDDAYALVAQADGDLLVVGSTSNLTPQGQSAQTFLYDAAGARIASWSADYFNVSCPQGVPEAFYNVIQEPDGMPVAVGFAQFDCGGPQRDFWIWRLDESGARQSGFARPAFFGGTDYGWSVARQPDGRLVVGGFVAPSNQDYELGFTRYTTDGEIDLTFGTQGETTIDIGSGTDVPYEIAIAPDGGIVVAGYAYDGSQYDMVLARLTPDGLPDPAFGADGVIVIDDGGDDFGLDLAMLPDGTFLVSGYAEDAGGVNRAFVARFLPDGTPDGTFGTSGRVTLDFTGLPAILIALAVQADSKIVAAGYTETGAGGTETLDLAIARLLPDGTLDPSFGTGGMQVASWGPGPDYVRDLAIAPDGDLVVVGSHRTTISEVNYHNIGLARFNGDTPPVSNEETPSHALGVAVTPNPVRHTAQIRFELAEAGPVELVVTDLLGRRMASLVAGEIRPSGAHSVHVDASSWAPGVYLIRLVAGNEPKVGASQLATQRLTVVR
ncbi:MAG: T9SS type A sorting domain-containing protein [Bacteroidota bacterium]